MADDPTTPPAPAKDDPAPPADLGDNGKKALADERKARRDAEQALAAVQAQLQELTDKDKSEVDRLRDENARLTKENGDLASSKLRLEIASAKGLTPTQAKRLVGSTKEELEADADEIIEAFPAASASKPPPSDRPKPTLRGGNDPSDEPDELDPRKLAEMVPRD